MKYNPVHVHFSTGMLLCILGVWYMQCLLVMFTCKHNILDLIFCPDDLVNYITTTNTFLSDHLMIHVSTSIPVHTTIPVAQSLNPSSNVFEKIDINRADWPQLAMSLNNIDWEHELYQLSTEMYLPFAINIIAEKCMLLIPKKSGKKKRMSMFHRKRIIFMRKRRKLAKILHLEELICDSHTQEKLHDEEIVVTKIKTDPNYFFRYEKKHSICLNEIGPLMGANKTLTSDKYEMCCSLLYQFNSVFTQPHSVTNPSSFFPMQPLERIIRKQVSSFIDKKGFLNSTQHGFRSGRSCLSALLNVIDDIMHMLDGGGSMDMVYLDFSKAFDKVDHGILLHKLKALGITGNLGMWFYNFLTNRSHFVRLPGGISADSPVLSGVPQGTVLGPLLFLIMIADINKDISESNLISFADDTRIYTKIHDVSDCNLLQQDLNHIYDWATTNNMFFNAQKFHYITFSSKESSCLSNVYINPELNIINPSSEVLDLGVYMSRNCTFDFHVSCVYKRCSNLSGWILRTFSTRETRTMMTLFKSLVLSRLDYASQLWSPHLLKSVYLLEKVQRSFTKHIAGMHTMSYEERLKHLNLYSIQRRRDRYQIIYLWKIIEKIVPNLSAPITCTYSERRGRSCAVLHVNVGRLGTLCYNSFRWRAIRMFNKLPKHIRMISSCSVDKFKSQLDKHLRNISELPCQPGDTTTV